MRILTEAEIETVSGGNIDPPPEEKKKGNNGFGNGGGDGIPGGSDPAGGDGLR